jgi:DNA polymerase I-like protein with 3'-5' exonuclease and polymerase domains
VNFSIVNSLEGLTELKDILITQFEIGFDIETTGLDCFQADITLIQFSTRDKQAYVIDVQEFERKDLVWFFEILKSTDVKFIGHHIKFDIKFIYQKYGVMLHNVYDTMITEGILYAGIESPYPSLYDLVFKYCKVFLDKSTRDNFIDNKEISYEMYVYAAEDVLYLFDIYDIQLSKIAEDKLEKVLDLESRLIPVIADMEHNGVLLDSEKWLELEKVAIRDADNLEVELIHLAGEEIDFSKFDNFLEVREKFSFPKNFRGGKKEVERLENLIQPFEQQQEFIKQFNLGSPYQIKAFINYLGIEVENTNAKTLEKVQHQHKFIKLLLDYRELTKRYSTYGSEFLKNINPITGRIHASFNQTGASTGRFSSDNPNLQNIPALEEYRACFVADHDYFMLCADYSQVELRLAGAVTGEPKYIEAFKNDIDIHTQAGSMLFDVDLENVEPDHRKIGKSFNFARQYGSTPYGLHFNFGVPLETAFELEEKYKRAYPVLDAVKTAIEDTVLRMGYSITPLGRKRYFDIFKRFDDGSAAVRHLNTVRREGFNHVIQGGSADIVKIAMANIYYNNPFGKLLKLIITVHDELEYLAHKSIKDDAVEFIKKHMEDAEQQFLGEIPAKVEIRVGDCWLH